MKSLLTSIATAIGVPSVFIFLAAKAQELPTVFETLWRMSTRLEYDPLLVSAIMLTAILIGGKGLDIVRERQERRQARVQAT